MIKHKKKSKMHVKRGDMVQVISGSYKNQVGKIIKVIPRTSQVIVEKLNTKIRHIKGSNQGESGKIISFEAPIHSSNVMIYSEKNQIRSRYHICIDEHSVKHRQLNKTQEIIDQ